MLYNRQLNETADPYTQLPNTTSRLRLASPRRFNDGLGLPASTSTSTSLSKIRTQGQSRNRSASLPSSRQVPRLTVETGCKSSLKPTVTNTPSRLPRPQQNPRKHQHSASLDIPKSSIPRPTSFSRPTPPSPAKPKASPIASPTKSIDISPARRFMKGEPEIVVKYLKSLLGPNTCFLDTLPLDDLAALHEREAMDLKSRFRGRQCSQSLSEWLHHIYGSLALT
jgi:hypothetical protein